MLVTNFSWIVDVSIYICLLKEINEDLIKIIEASKDDVEGISDLFFSISMQLNRLIPIHYNKSTKKKDNIKDGVLQLSKYIDFLQNDYNTILKKYYNLLSDVNDVRNKFEHEPHNILWVELGIDNSSKIITYRYRKYDILTYETAPKEIKQKILNHEIKTRWIIKTNDLIDLVIELNNIYEKILKKFKINFEAYKDDNYYVRKIYNLELSSYSEKLKSYRK